MKKPSTLQKSVSQARNKVKVQSGLKMLVTPEIVEYLRKRKEFNGNSPFPPSAVLMVFNQNQDKSWSVGAVESALMIPLPEHIIRAGAVAHQVMQLGFTAEKFFRAVAEKAGGFYQGMQRLQGVGWIGHVLMSENKEMPDTTMFVEAAGRTAFPWIYTSPLPDAAMEEGLDIVPEKLIETYVQGLVMNYVNDKWRPQPTEYIQ